MLSIYSEWRIRMVSNKRLYKHLLNNTLTLSSKQTGNLNEVCHRKIRKMRALNTCRRMWHLFMITSSNKHRSPVNSTHKGQWRKLAFMFFLSAPKPTVEWTMETGIWYAIALTTTSYIWIWFNILWKFRIVHYAFSFFMLPTSLRVTGRHWDNRIPNARSKALWRI